MQQSYGGVCSEIRAKNDPPPWEALGILTHFSSNLGRGGALEATKKPPSDGTTYSQV